MKYQNRTWYVTLIAMLYLIFCSTNVLYLAQESFRPGFVTSLREVFPLAAAVFAWLYFFAPRWGHRGLIVLTVLVILAIGESDPGATAFHFTIFVSLMLPFFTRRQPRDLQKPDLTASSD